jgi:hypothetical protein
VLEIYVYEKGVITGIRKGGRKKDYKSKEHKRYRMNTLDKNRNYIRRLINCNFTNNAKFVTLTFITFIPYNSITQYGYSGIDTYYNH